MKNMVLDTISLYESKSSVKSIIIIDKIDALEHNFIDKHEDDDSMLPIPLLSNTSPENFIHFLIHIILSLGQYNTEIDALSHASFKECLRAVNLIGDNDDEQSLKQYVKNLMRQYIESQVVF